MKLRLSARANADLDHIYQQGLERFGTAAATDYLSELIAKFSLLLVFPLSNPSREDIHPPVRLQIHKGHVIIYRVGNEYVDIIRVMSRFQSWQDAI